MIHFTTRKGKRLRGFTLIELLVVVAIIALLISILLPSLGSARAQARTSLCASRIAQMAKASLMYADDYSETPPFISPVTSEAPDRNPWESVAATPTSHMETWLGSQSNMAAVILASHAGTGYPINDPNITLPRTGTLFDYARFEGIYKCPEFDRIGGKEQSVFNYTRSVWARKYRRPGYDIGATTRIDWNGMKLGDLGGPILKPSTVYAPSSLPMFEDEWWDRHVAGTWGNAGNVETKSWLVCDPVFDIIDELGQYHGAKSAGKFGTGPYNPPIQSGSLAYYDGHVNLRRDPGPSREPDERKYDDITVVLGLLDMLVELGYAQLGVGQDGLAGI